MANTVSYASFKRLIDKYGKVALGVHLSVSVVSITCCYTAIKNNVDVGAVLQRVGLYSDNIVKEEAEDFQKFDAEGTENSSEAAHSKEENRQSAVHSAVAGGGALALAFLCNKALMPVRIPITVVLTPPVARLLARRNLFKP